MKTSKEYGPQFDPADGTIGTLQLVKRWALTNPDDGLVWPARRGQFTYGTVKEASAQLDAVKASNSKTHAPEVYRLLVRAVWCYPRHYDPCGLCE
jgi:hypothetical protein